jgi:syntaxin 1B/2/3
VAIIVVIVIIVLIYIFVIRQNNNGGNNNNNNNTKRAIEAASDAIMHTAVMPSLSRRVASDSEAASLIKSVAGRIHMPQLPRN